MIGGSADLAPSNKTDSERRRAISQGRESGRQESCTSASVSWPWPAIGNGIMLHGGLRAYVATFFVFSDYVKPDGQSVGADGRAAHLRVLTHDSIGVGEDGPTHEPIEQLAMLRAMPGFPCVPAL